MLNKYPGRFIVFEGGEGAGKTTQIERTAAYLRNRSIPVVTTREPGGTANAEALRHVIVNGRVDGWQSISEALVMFAARAEHVANVIKPALAKGQWVICDRFAESTFAYQGAGGNVSRYVLEELYRWTVIQQGVDPDLTILLDVEPRIGLARAAARGEDKSRFEGKAMEFHMKVRKAFLEMAEDRRHGAHVVIDATSMDIGEIQYAVQYAVSRAFEMPLTPHEVEE